METPLLYLSLYLKKHRDLYYELLQRTRSHNEWEAWIRFFLEGVRETAQQATETAERIVGLFREDRSRIAGARSSATLKRLHEELQRISSSCEMVPIRCRVTQHDRRLTRCTRIGPRPPARNKVVLARLERWGKAISTRPSTPSFARSRREEHVERVGRVTVDDRPAALRVIAPFFSRARATALAVAMVPVLGLLAWLGWQQLAAPIGMGIVAAISIYFAAIFIFDRTDVSIVADWIIVRRGPIPFGPATRVAVATIREIRAGVLMTFVRSGGRVELDAVAACLSDGRTVVLIDDAGAASDADALARRIAERLGVASSRGSLASPLDPKLRRTVYIVGGVLCTIVVIAFVVVLVVERRQLGF